MKIEGQRRFKEVSRLMDESKSLDMNLVERGVVFKKVLYEDQKNYIAILLVGPQSKIRLHQHTEDSEEYKDLDTQVSEVCKMGDWHYLENESETKWLVILAHKYR